LIAHLIRLADETGEPRAYVIAQPCVVTKDTACVDVCPCDCILPTKAEAEFATASQLYINPEDCIDCGVCIPACPVSTIYPADDLAEKWKGYAFKNADGYAVMRT
jgi:ferredoxin